MADVCAGCGKKFSGFGRVAPCSPEAIKKLNARQDMFNVDTENLCNSCVEKELKQVYYAVEQEFEAARQGSEIAIAGLCTMPVMTTPAPAALETEILGIASGHSVIGTGPISSIASAFTDFFGKESMAYLEKIRTAEKSAMLSARIQAVEMGGTALCGCTLTVSEATSGHGMIMVSFVGTVIRVKGDESTTEPSTRYLSANKILASLQEKRQIIKQALHDCWL